MPQSGISLARYLQGDIFYSKSIRKIVRVLQTERLKNLYIMARLMKKHPLLSMINGMVIDLPAPANISYL